MTYRLGHQIGIGAFSKVYRGTDSWGNPVVAKVLAAGAHTKLWEREVLALHRFRHPCVVYLLASFTHGDHHFLVMEDAGVCVARLTYASKSAARACLSVARGVLQALHFVHSGAYVHGDVCPNNVLAQSPKGDIRVRLADFAFCRSAKSAAEGPPMVAPWQHAPENLSPMEFGQPGAATDIYLAALTLYRVLTDDRRQFTQDEALRGEPRAAALALGSPLGDALALGLEPETRRRPSAAELWQRLCELNPSA